MHRFASRRLLGYTVALLACILALGWLAQPYVTALSAPSATQTDPVAAAWSKARAAGSYHFQSDVIQMTMPTAKVTNVGRTSQTQTLHLEGQTDIRKNQLEMRLWSDGGSVLQNESGVAVKVENGKTFVRQGTNGQWRENADFTDALAPQGDFMAYLQAVRNVKAHAPEKRAGIPLTRYSFTIDGPTFAVFVRDQMEAALRAKGELPNSVNLDVPQYYRAMTGDGELWVGENGLPLRQILNLDFPEQSDATTHAQIVVDFSHFGVPQPSRLADWRNGGLSGLLNRLASTLPNLLPVGLAFVLGALALVVFRYRRSRPVYTGLVTAILLSMVLGPLLSTLQVDSFFAAQAAKAAAQKEQQTNDKAVQEASVDLGRPAFNPHVNPIEADSRRVETNLRSPVASRAAAPLAATNVITTDTGVDSDSDGLTDFAEARVGTDPTNADTDDDSINDALEVKGFPLGGQTWYANAQNGDSNNDGIGDGQEWDNNGDGKPDDTDGDGIPDIFDNDNDNDGVPDRQDMAPFSASAGATPFTENNPLKLTLNNLAANTPTLVDFQVRPTDPNHLWYAFNVVDWPRNDNQGQVQDIDGGTFADLAGSQGRTPAANEAFGDMKLVPMLEIRINGAVTNLPPQSALTPYNISVNNLVADGSQKAVYIPLSVVNDDQTGQRVAFTARMNYLPSGAWPSPHDVRLAWVVQTLVDLPCDHSNAQDVAAGCATDNYIHNAPQVTQSYYDDFTLTGLNVSEQHGAKTALIYEDPAVDPNLKDDVALTALSHGLDQSFLAGRHFNSNTVRDVDINEIARRFERTTNTGISSDQRWGLVGPLNILRVERHDYPTFDQAAIFTAMTDTVGILNRQFNIAWTNDNTLKPTIAYAYEQQSRGLGLDASKTSGGYVTLSATGVTVNMQPGATTTQVPLNTMVGLKWTHYCRANSSVAWSDCASDDYWQELQTRYGNLPLSDESSDPNIVAGSNVVMQLHNLALDQGVSAVVQSNDVLVSGLFPTKTDSEIETNVRSGLTFGGAAVKKIANLIVMDRILNNEVAKARLGQNVGDFLEGSATREYIGLARINPHVVTLLAISAAATAAVLVDGYLLSTLAQSKPAVLATRIVLRTLAIGIQTYSALIDPVLTLKRWYDTEKSVSSTISALRGSSEAIGVSRTANAIGAVISIAIVWGFFIYSMVSNHVSTSSPEFSKALAETIAATVYIIILTILAATVVGLILVGIVSIIDAVLTAVCELGGDNNLKNQPGQKGSCFTLGATATKAIAYLLYNYDLMIDTKRNDMVSPGAPTTTLANPSKGFVTGNDFTITMPITTHVVHKSPDASSGLYINFYLWLFSRDNLKSTTFNYTLTQPGPQDVGASLGQMTGAWRVAEDHKYVATPMYGGFANSAPTINGFNLQPGLNQPANFYLNMGYALPAYECWVIPVPLGFVPVTPICRVRTFTGKSSTAIDTLRYDIFPNTIGGFMALTTKPSGGQGFAWDASFDALPDADGDGLVSTKFGGLDPNDGKADSDNDGLTDAFEVNRRADGVPYSPIQCDTDGDGLTDGQEAQIGSNPSVADTDNDGLNDGAEVWHQVYNTSTCQPTNVWSGGWDITINAAAPFTIRVSSDPTQADADADGLSDLAEKQLVQSTDLTKRVDKDNRPWNPLVFNTSPLTVLTDVNDQDHFVGLGQDLIYTTTVIADAPTAPGMLDVNAPGEVGGSKLPVLLNFDPNNFSNSQTVVNQTNFTVQSGANRQALNFTSNVRTRLGPSGPSVRTWDPIAFQTLANTAQPTRFMGATAFQPFRQDSYQLITANSSSAGGGGVGDITATRLPNGQLNTVFSTATDGGTMSSTPADIACNDNGACLVVWETSGTVKAQFINPDGTLRCCVATPLPASGNAFRPVIATDGANFVVAYVVAGSLFTDIVTVELDSNGTRIISSGGSGNISGLVQGSNDIALDLVWNDGFYYLAWKYIGIGGVSNQIRSGILGRDGTVVFQFGLETDQAATTAAGAPVLAHNSANGLTLLLYQSSTGEVRRILLSGSSNPLPILADANLGPAYFGAGPLSATVDPRTNEWLISFDRQVLVYDAFFTTKPLPDLFATSIGQMNMACPARSSLPVADLRFDEFPGANNFGGATCSGNSCPAAGLPSATDNLGNAIGTPASDYSIQFDGIDDQLSLNNPLGSAFSVAFWYRATGGASSNPFSVQSNQPAGFGLFIYNTSPNVTEFFVGDNVTGRIATPNGLADGKWHYIVATRAQSGALALYLDGNPTPVASSSSSPAPTMGSTISIGGGSTSVGLDNLQLYNVALDGAMVQALYQRSNQSYCVGVHNNAWTKLNISQPDNRGGKITNSGGLVLTLDTDKPSSSISGFVNGQWVQGNKIYTIGGNASDPTSSVAKVEIKPGVNANWEQTSGAASWAYNLAVTQGAYTLQTRATDAVGNVETPNTTFVLNADSTGPDVGLNALPNVQQVTTRNSAGQWLVTLSGTASDQGSGIPAVGVVVTLQGQGSAVGNGGRTATYSNGNWTVNYDLPQGLADPTGVYTVSVRAIDNVDNLSATDAVGILRIDNAGPAAALNPADATRAVISDTITLSGVLTDTGTAGVDKLEVAFVPVEAIAPLPNTIDTAQADAQLNRTWLPATVAQRGASVSGWSLPVPAGLEDEYQIDLRATDKLGNVLRTDHAWRGIIDTLAPRVNIANTNSGVTFLSQGFGRVDLFTLYTLSCSVTDRYLNDASFGCPANAFATPVHTFDTNPVLQALFPDRTIQNGLTNSTAYWAVAPVPPVSASACDNYGHCATANAGAAAKAQAGVQAASVNAAAASPGAPVAVIVAPTAGSFVAGSNALSVTVAAEAGASLKQVAIRLDNNVVQTLNFAQTDTVTRTLRTVNVAGVSEGQHTLTALATDWANATQTSSFPVTFTLDAQPPTVTINPTTLTNADTWQPGSDILRFKGTASDSAGLAAVQIREGTNPFSNATFGNGTWQTALLVTNPEGRALNIVVRAIDRAGRVSQTTQTIGTNLSSATPPDTSISASPTNPSAVNTASFAFTGTVTAPTSPEVAAFECQLDNSLFTACASPQSYSDLSKGSHTFGVRAIDSQGNVDLSPASFTWTVNASALDTTITSSPANPTNSRSASFAFTGTGNAFDCALDAAAFGACTSPQNYSSLAYGDHVFQVRARNGNQTGAATRFAWTILNAAPVANSQTVTTTEATALAITLTASDSDPLTYKVGNPAHGVLIGTAPNLTYIPNTGYFGTDSFTFQANDGQTDSNVATVNLIVVALDRVAPTSTITLAPPTPNGQNNWYKTPVRVTVTATDGADPKAAGVGETRCVLDPVTPPATFAALSAGCSYLGTGADVTTDGLHTIYAASKDKSGNQETPVSKSFQVDKTPPVVTVTGVSSGATYALGAVPVAGCNTADATAGVATVATVQVTGGNAQGVGNFTATCNGATDKAGNASIAVTAPYTVSYNLNKFVVLAQEGVAFDQNATINSGDVGARIASAGPFLASNAEVSFGPNGKMLDTTSHLLGNRLAIQAGAIVYNPSYNSWVNSGTVRGTPVTPLNLKLLPSLPALPTITPGTQNLTVAQNGTLTLNPGNYGTFTSGQGATITFKGGLYQFNSFTAGQNNKLYFQAATEIRVAGKVSVGQGNIIGPAPTATTLSAKDIVFYVAGRNGANGALTEIPKAVAIGQNSTLNLNVLAPNGTLQVDQNANATGAYLARWVAFGQAAKLTLNSRFVTGAAGAASVETPDQGIPPADTTPVAQDNTFFLPIVTLDAAQVTDVVGEQTASEADATPLTETLAVTPTAVLTTPVITPTVPTSTTSAAAGTPVLLYLPVVSSMGQ